MWKYKRIITITLLLVMLITSLGAVIPTAVLADRDSTGPNPGRPPSRPTPPSPPPAPNPSPSEPSPPSSGGSTPKDDEDDDKEDTIIYVIECKEPNFRTMQVLDVVSVMNDNVESIADYRPNMLPYLTSLPDFQLADIKEYLNFGEESRHKRMNVEVVDDKQKEYSYKVKTLIDENILSRDNHYVVNTKGAYIAPEDDKDGVRTTKRWEDPNELISRTDFLVELMKTEEVIMSSPIIVRSKYSRTTHLKTFEFIDVEPVETSPYQDRMGEMGIDTGQTDVIIDHRLFGRMSTLATNDVTELYLSKAFNKGLIREDELLSVGSSASAGELVQFLKDKQPTTFAPANGLPPRWALTEEPLRKGYIKEYPTDKVWEDDNMADGQYPQKLGEWEESKDIMELGIQKFLPNSSFWGQSYTYGGLKTGDEYNNWFDPAEFTITRRKSKLQDPENGYSYFKSENLTLMDAYIYASKQMKESEGEKALTQAEIEFLNSSYSLNMTSMRKDEKEAVNYLLAKGIINGDDMNLYKSIYLPLTNKDAVDILWKINQPGERMKITPVLTELDQQMLSKGYSQATIEVKESKAPKSMAYLDTGSGSEVNPLARRDIFKIFTDYKDENKAVYDLIFIRQPKLKEGDANQNLRLVINDPYRTELQSFYITAGINATEALDDFGYAWKGYMVHKDSSSDLMILGSSDKEIYTIDGINGEGFYWVPDEKPVTKASKWTAEEFLNNPSVFSYINKHSQPSNVYTQMKQVLQFKDSPTITSSITDNDLLTLARIQKNAGKDMPVSEALSVLANITDLNLDKEKFTNFAITLDKVESKSRDVGKVIWKSPTYLAEGATPKDIIYGPLREDELKQLKYSNDYVALFSGNTFTVNTSNKDLPKKADGVTPKIVIKSEDSDEGKLYYIHLTPNTFSYDVELANFTQKLSVEDGTPGKKLPGYAQMTDRDGEPFVIISKSELTNFNIVPISDKILENTVTGQRAFLNTDDNYTLIGNNLTHYLPGDMLVYAYGAGSDHTMETGQPDKIFYNLNVVLELINDTNIVSQSAGKSIQININPDEKFEVVKVQDAENRLEGDRRTVIDQTYILNSSQTASGRKSYVNLSALGGPTSNFIYYKDKATTSTVEALVVYKPKAVYQKYVKETLNTLKAQMGKSGGSEKSTITESGNRIAFTTGLGEDPLTAKEKEIEEIKNQIISKLFIGGQEDKPFIGEDYIYNIYILTKIDTEEGKKAAQDAFMARIVGTDKTVWDKIKEYTTYRPGDQSEVSEGEQDLTISVIPVGISPTQETDLLEHTATGNLYMYMGKSGDANVSAKQSEQYRKLFYQNMYLNISRVEGVDNYQLMFRQKHYYQNTPDNHIPLERYAEHSGSFGSMFISGGTKMVNFLTNNPGSSTLKNHYTYRLPSNEINNNFIIRDGETTDVGLFSHIEMPWIELNFDSPMQGLNGNNEIIQVDLKEAKNEIEMTKMLYTIMIKAMQDEFNKTVAPVPNVPNGVADGDLADKVAYSIPEVMKTSKVGFAENKPDIIRNLMQGTWDGILPGRADNSQFNIYSRAEVPGITIPVSQPNTIITTEDDDEDESEDTVVGGAVVLAVGRNPEVIDSKNKSVKEGKLMALSVEKNSDGLIKPITYDTKAKKEIKEVNGYSELKKFAKGRKVYIKPSIGIPHGTTVVDRRGGLLMRKNPTPREEVLYSSDIINSLILRMQQGNNYEGKVFIHELDAGSVIKLGDNRYVMKTSPKQPRDSGTLKWVEVVTLPASERERGGEADKKGMNDFSMMSRFLSTWGNTVMIPYNIAAASVPLKSIVGKGVYSIPTIDELNVAVNALDDKASKHFTSPVWSKQVEDVGKVDYDVVGATGKKKIFSILDKTHPNMQFSPKVDLTKAIPIIEIPLPPTIAVTQAKGDALDYHYEVEMYYDIKGFNVDKDDSYIQYLRDRDTNAKDVLEGLEQLRTGTLEGLKYRDYAKTKRFNRTWEKILEFLSAIVPIVCVFLITILLLLYLAFRLPMMRNVLINISERFDLRLATDMMYGGLTTDNLPSIVNVSIACVILATIALLFWDMTGLKMITYVYINIKNAIFS